MLSDLILGIDRIGRDIFARLIYGYRIAMSFALLVAAATYFIGTIIGIAMGYFGGTFDTISQRFIEIWERIPYLYMVMILAYPEHRVNKQPVVSGRVTNAPLFAGEMRLYVFPNSVRNIVSSMCVHTPPRYDMKRYYHRVMPS